MRAFRPHRNALHRASDKLFADAAREETKTPQRGRTPTRIHQHENWDGDEKIEDAVLRMLVDKYKPLRTGTIQSAEQKLKHSLPCVATSSQVIVRSITPSTGSWATEPLLQSSKDHQPWHTQFKPPSHETPLVKTGWNSPKPLPQDDREQKKEREIRRKAENGTRLARARESTLDYRLGIKYTGPQINPVSLKGWDNLIEDKIQKAQEAGLFRDVKGRGQPLVRHTDETNPFIAREEFLMNRIVQRNGTAPPWVELQNELDTAIRTFREILRQSWVRQAVRSFTSSIPFDLLHNVTISDVTTFRDAEWQRREQKYHQVALEEVNALVRKYNGLAPYAVRRAYLIQSVEYEKLFEACAQEIFQELRQRAERGEGVPALNRDSLPTTTETHVQLLGAPRWSFLNPFSVWLRGFLARLWSR